MVKDIPYDSSRSQNIVFEEYKALKGFVTLKKKFYHNKYRVYKVFIVNVIPP